ERTAIRPGSRRACVDVDEPHLIDSARANIADLTHKPPRQFTFDEEIPRVYLLALRLLGERRRSSVCRKRKHALAKIGCGTAVNQTQPESGDGNERVGRAVETDRRHGPDIRDGESVSYVLERSWIGGLSITAAQHCLVVPAKCDSHARQKLSRSGFSTAVEWHAGQPAREDLSSVRIEAVDAGVVFSRDTKQLPAQTISECHPASNLPVIASVKCILFPPHRVRITQLVHLARLRWHAQQEVGPTME